MYVEGMSVNRVRLKDVAEEVGLSVQAVSMAMRGHRQIAESTRQRVQAVAKRMGYQADPAMAALASYRTDRARGARKWEVITLVSDWEKPGAWRQYAIYERLWRALVAETEARGITLEEQWLGQYGANAKSGLRKLRDAGRHGLLLAPASLDEVPHPIELPTNGFQVVSFGPANIYPDYHVVQWDHYQNLVLAWKHLRDMGRRRVGLAYLEIFGWRTGHAWLGAYLAEQRQLSNKDEIVAPGIVPKRMDPESWFLAWAHEQRPDAVITIVYQVRQWVKKLPWPVDVALLDTEEGKCMGVNLNPVQAARTAVELLLLEMQKSLVAQQDLPFRVQIPGRWVAGAKGP